MAFLYLADRSTCVEAGASCDRKQPARFDEDVLPAADAFLRANAEGALVGAMRDTLDMVLVRNPDAGRPNYVALRRACTSSAPDATRNAPGMCSC